MRKEKTSSWPTRPLQTTPQSTLRLPWRNANIEKWRVDPFVHPLYFTEWKLRYLKFSIKSQVKRLKSALKITAKSSTRPIEVGFIWTSLKFSFFWFVRYLENIPCLGIFQRSNKSALKWKKERAGNYNTRELNLRGTIANPHDQYYIKQNKDQVLQQKLRMLHQPESCSAIPQLSSISGQIFTGHPAKAERNNKELPENGNEHTALI